MSGFDPIAGFRRAFICILTCCCAPVLAGPINTAIPQTVATRTLTMCVIDGRNGHDLHHQDMLLFKQAALGWGLEITPITYQDAQAAEADFRAGHCDLINLPGTRAQHYNRFTGSLEAAGALPSYEHLRTLIRVLALAKATPLMRQDDYEVVAILPDGTRTLWASNSTLSDPGQLRGKTLGLKSGDIELQQLASLTSMVPLPLADEATTTRQRQDLISGHTAAFRTSQTPDGGILAIPFKQTTLQIVARHSQLPEQFGLHARQFAEQQFDHFLQPVMAQEQQLPAGSWIPVPASATLDWANLLQQVRIRLRNDAIYDADALTLMRKIRCTLDSSRLECNGGENQVE